MSTNTDRPSANNIFSIVSVITLAHVFIFIVLLAWAVYVFWKAFNAVLQWYFIILLILVTLFTSRLMRQGKKLPEKSKDWSDLIWNFLAFFGVGTFVAKTGGISDWSNYLPPSLLTAYVVVFGFTAAFRAATVLTKIRGLKQKPVAVS